MSLAPGQSRPLTFCLTLRKPEVASISFVITYVVEGDSRILCSTTISSAITSRNISEPHRITFLHPGGIVSYAVLRAPQIGSIKTSPVVEKLPILLNLHGAGLEADSYEVRHMLDSVPHLAAWVLFPAGVTPWSGDDWRKYFSYSMVIALRLAKKARCLGFCRHSGCDSSSSTMDKLNAMGRTRTGNVQIAHKRPFQWRLALLLFFD